MCFWGHQDHETLIHWHVWNAAMVITLFTEVAHA